MIGFIQIFVYEEKNMNNLLMVGFASINWIRYVVWNGSVCKRYKGSTVHNFSYMKEANCIPLDEEQRV